MCVCVSFSLAKLQRLSVTDNQLEDVPPELGQLSNLVELNLTRNKLISLPGRLYACRQLAGLYLARNRITNLPEVSDIFLFQFDWKNKCDDIPEYMTRITGNQGISEAQGPRRGRK